MAIHLNQDGENGDVVVDINTTPLIDVMLVLLIMLIITIRPPTHSINLDMPEAAAPSMQHPQIVKLAIDANGRMLWNGTEISDRATLEGHLGAAAQQVPQPEIHISPDERVRYAVVAMVLAEAQRLGITKIGLVGDVTPRP